MLTVNNGWIIISVYYAFTMVVQRISNCDKIQDTSLTLDKLLNTEQFDIWIVFFCVIIGLYTSYQRSEMYGFYWVTLYMTFIHHIGRLSNAADKKKKK